MFEKASRMKLRFEYKGSCSTEDLWDLSLSNLDNLYKKLTKQKRDSEGDSLLDKGNETDSIRDLQIEIIKYVVEVRLQEKKKETDAKERSEKKQRILAIIDEKQQQNLRDLPVEELTKILEEL